MKLRVTQGHLRHNGTLGAVTTFSGELTPSPSFL